jgi:hypothetical protein
MCLKVIVAISTAKQRRTNGGSGMIKKRVSPLYREPT